MRFAPGKASRFELLQHYLSYPGMVYYENDEPIMVGQDRAVSDPEGKVHIISKSMLPMDEKTATPPT
jgi:hypothetical protein